MKSFNEDTITAISTGSGSAGIGIIRISGPEAIPVAKRLFESVSGKDLEEAPSGKMLYGWIKDPKTDKRIDEVLLLKMKGPHSYTAEDVVEINCHGGIVPTRKILSVVLDQGIRHAEPGEFTKRAFLNGRIDLTQAESVMDVIASRSEKALEISVDQLSGSLKNRIKQIDAKLIDLLVLIDSNLDYPEYDIEELTDQKILTGLDEVEKDCQRILQYAKNGYLLREGVKTAIIGKPNVGKSSLLNLLLGEERAIVTDIPGTTRDVIHESILIHDIPFVITDTAGIRETEDAVEKIGVERSKEAAQRADLVLFMRDVSEPLDEDEIEILRTLDPKKTLFIANKTDILEQGSVSRETLDEDFTDLDWIDVSVKEDQGLERIEERMVEAVSEGDVEGSENAVMLNERQENLLRQVVKSVQEARGAVETGMPAEVYAIDIVSAEEKLREITGEALGEDVIDTIFERFCIGK